jgi:hypothetical protein
VQKGKPLKDVEEELQPVSEYYKHLRVNERLTCSQAYALVLNGYHERMTGKKTFKIKNEVISYLKKINTFRTPLLVGTRLCCKAVSQAAPIIGEEWVDLKGCKIRPERQGYPMGAVSASEAEDASQVRNKTFKKRTH